MKKCIIHINKMKNIKIYSDGACSGNPGPGGWGAILLYNTTKKEISGGSAQTTNNIMEITAVIESLSVLKESCSIDFYSDSKYVIDGITNWIHSWKKQNWKNSAKKPVKNLDLWLKLDKLASKHQINWHWVKGHADNFYNNRCDELAVQAIQQYR
jgi:ribonuclease HI